MSASLSTLLLIVSVLVVHGINGDPVVTLSHGGRLQGRSESFMDTPVDLFLGVRYAKPPVGDLRFKKPEEFPGWEGTVDAKTIASPCPQIDMFGQDPTKPIGKEDCLTLDITIPGGVKAGAKKPVMVWIHGGGYAAGTGTSYIAGPMAVTGDVIIVSINYRLGILGFLATTKGTGNYGLWDQRAALLWVKENIEQFGGDPDLVTIFGESAGGGSVSCQLIGQHNDGLFKRGITQSGSAFMMLAGDKHREMSSESVRLQAGCATDQDLYDCLSKLSAHEILSTIQVPAFTIPAADGDFFSWETTDQYSYSLSHRFDLMAGVNGQEGGLMYAFEFTMFAAQQNISVEEGVSMQLVQDFLLSKCKTQLTPFSPNLCADFLIRTYQIDEAADDKERAARLTDFLGEILFDIDTINQLKQHSTGGRSTYGYYFTDLTGITNPLWSIPDWLKVKADHADELVHIFGAAYITAEAKKVGIWKDILAADSLMSKFINKASEEVSLTLDMIKMWTNFAKTGNPNTPMPISSDVPTWPEFTSSTNQLLELNRKQNRVVSHPNKERMDSLRSNLFQAVKLQQDVGIASSQTENPAEEKLSHDEL